MDNRQHVSLEVSQLRSGTGQHEQGLLTETFRRSLRQRGLVGAPSPAPQQASPVQSANWGSVIEDQFNSY